MKIGILTLPLHNNYGGLLQCYAMQAILKRIGHDAIVLCRVGNKSSLYIRAKGFLYGILKERKKGYPYDMSKIVGVHTRNFVEKYISPRSPLLFSTEDLAKETVGIDVFLVGSDQVWRPMYSPCIENFFLDFAQDRNVRRVAYAASFGVDDWEFTEEQTVFCARFARMFDAISVREDSAVNLCNKYLGVGAIHLLDPTMLLERKDYEALVIAEDEKQSLGNLFCYVLDEDKEKQSLIQQMADYTGLIPFNCMPMRKMWGVERCGQISDYIYPSPTRWLRSFMDAKMVFTDSFHGCVFSIIFNKPFWVIGNSVRGMARFNSLLKMFGLEDRIVTIETFDQNKVFTPVNWTEVNACRTEWRKKSMDFLVKNLA